MTTGLTLENPVFKAYAFYSALCVAKLLVCALLTSYRRLTRGVFVTQEDCDAFGGKKGPRFDDEPVERIRRNHQNDIENIIPFILTGLLYVLINPTYSSALWHFRVFFFSRLIHFFVYQFHIAQPSRALAFAVGIVTTVSMLFRVIATVY